MPKHHKPLTYRQLLNSLNSLPLNNLDDTVSVFNHNTDEYMHIVATEITNEDCDVLDEGHLVLVME